MADSGGRARRKTKTKDSKKRKLRSPEQADRPPKTHCSENTRELAEFGHVEELERREPNQEFLEEGSPWRNLQLILLLQNKELDLQKKVELAFGFVKMRATEEGKGADQDYQPVKLSRLIVFLNDWIQSLLIPSERKMRGGRQKPQGEVFETCLDFRCWEIFLFCLEQSLKLQVSLHFSRNLLRSFSSIAKNAVSLADDTFLCSQESLFIGEDFKMYIIVLNCMPFVFASHGGFSNENLELWISTVDAVLDLVLKVYAKKLDSSNMGVFTLRFSCLVLEPFANFLRIHPARKTGFHGFIDKLLEPLMHLLGVLNLQIGRSNSHWTESLLKQVREVLSSGLFHPVHIDGFLSLHSTEKYAESPDGKPKNTKTVIKSYHRHLFEKLEKVLTEKKVSAIASFGELFCLLVHRVKVLKRTSGSSPDTKMMGKTGASKQREDNSLDCEPKTSFESSSVPQHNNRCPSSFNADTRKSLFDFFVQIMEPLLLKIDACAQVRLEVESDLMGVHSTLKSMNSLLASFVHEMVYVRTEDTSEGACFNFLKKVYDIVMSFSTNLLWSAKYFLDNQKLIELLTFSANEVLVTVGHLLEIEYEVIGNDLLSLWLMMFSYSAVALSLVDMVDQSSLPSKIEALGCQLVNLYSQLRQVSDAIFALSKAARLVISRDDDHEINYNGFIAPLPSEAYARSVGMLLSSQEFKGAVCVAIRSIPEGQASGCVRQLTADISESLEWLKTSCSVVEGKEVGQLKVNDVQGFDLQAEILGRVLSELYALVVNSVTVTTGNSSLLVASIKDLMTLLHPCLNCLFGIEPDSVNKFLFTVTGRNLDIGVVGNKGDMPKSRFSTYRVFLFFFQLYMCCRSLYRQAISLMPPDVSRKMSEGMGDSFTAYCGKDWIERTELDDKGYFSWILQSSASLLAVIQSVSNIYLHSRTEDCYPLLYVLHAMALQRLVDLNREIKSLEYLLQRNDNLVQNNLVDGAAVSLYRKKSRRMEKRISLLRKEAAGLTDFIMGHLSFLANDQQLMSDGATCMDETKEWDFGICTINKKSLPTAIWWILCQNVDIWCTHASKKKMKLFLSVLIHTSLPLTSNYVKVGMQNNNVASQLKQITISQISSELLSDSIFYEQKIVRRYFASRFCHVLEKSASLLSRDFSPGNVDLNSLPHWPQVLDVLEKSLVDVCSNKQATDDCLFVSKPLAHSSDKLPTEIFKEQTAILSVSTEFTACRSLLNLLCSMPKEYLNSKSLLRYETYLLNLERFVVGRLLECQGTLNLHSYQELFRLFVSCRKALKYIITTACDKRTRASDSSFIPTFPDDSLFALWLCKSAAVVVGLQQAVSEDNAYQVKDLTFALMDHTSYVFLTLSKHQFSHSVQDLFDAKKLCKEQTSSGTADQRSNFNESNRSLEPTNCVEAWKSAFLVSKTLMEQTQNFLTSSRDAFCTQKLGLGDDVVKLKTFSSVVSCFSGFLWGLASAINDASTRYSDNKVKLSGLKSELVLELNLCINVFEKFISSFLHMFLIDDQQARSFLNTQGLRKLDYGQNFVEAQGTSLEGSHAQAEISSDRQQQILAAAKTSASIDIDDDSGNASLKRSQLKCANFSATLLTEADSFDSQCLNKALLQNLLKGDNPEAAFALRQLLIGSSAILKLKLHINKISSLSSLVAFFVGISQVLLSSFVYMVETPQPFCFVWLDGVLKYLEELGNHFPSASPTLSGNVYAKLIELHLRAVGKCITLQGKRATLASHETESSTKTLYGHIGLSEASNPHGPYSLDEFKSRLRMSFKMFIKKPSELNLLSAIQAIERALVGVREQCTMIYDITTGNIGGGKVSSIVAAAIDCFDLVLEYVSGRKRLSVLKTHIQGLVAGLFNIILHLESPSIFYVRSIHSKGDSGPDPGAVILMCVEVLTRVSGKHALFQMAAWHVGQVLRIPGALFQDFCRLELSDAPISSHSSLAEDNKVSDPVARDFYAIDRCFSVDLFAACCRLLYTVLKHHKSECERSIALLEASVSVLLNCLEMVDADSVVRKEYFSWELEEGVKCACFLRRIYEEIRQQKDVLGRHCSQFLSNYIWVYSGYGPLKTGIRREIDEALRPGLYALVDACSADDLQYLHTVFGEGPCRNTLATLRHDYKLNFQYAGKV